MLCKCNLHILCTVSTYVVVFCCRLKKCHRFVDIEKMLSKYVRTVISVLL